MIFRKNRKTVAILLSSLFLLHQSMLYQALASTITDMNGNDIPKIDGSYNIRPDAINGDIGFKEFKDLNLSQGDVLNFIFQWYQEYGAGTPNHVYKQGDIDTFVNLVSNQIQINGIVNALTRMGGDLKQNGNLVFISPNGMVVGASGVLNVGSLSVFTPTTDSFNKLREGMPTDVKYSSTNHNIAVNVDKTFNPADITTGNAAININGKVLARGDVELKGGSVNIGGTVLAGVGNNTDKFTDPSTAANQANKLFEELVNTDNMNLGNGFANADGKIDITSTKG